MEPLAGFLYYYSMISRIRIKSFQSLLDIDLKPKLFTVVVGPSDSGKSALVRALKTLAYNSHSSDFVTRGRRVAAIEVKMDDHTVVLERGKAHSVYKIDDETYTKSGNTTPTALVDVIRLPLLEFDNNAYALNFASQFDKPFLLDEPATKVAKILGELTKINVLYSAIQEANRRRLAMRAQLRMREEDLASISRETKRFAGLAERRAKHSDLEGLFSAVKVKAVHINDLRDLIARSEQSAVSIEALRRRAGSLVDGATLLELEGKWRLLDELMAKANRSAVTIEQLNCTLASIVDAINELEAGYHERLLEAGECPVCGQSTKNLKKST